MAQTVGVNSYWWSTSAARTFSLCCTVLSAASWLAAGITILQPEVTNTVARFLGIGRGADLVLYVVSLSFLVSLVYFYHKYRQLNSDLTEIVRSLAIQDAEERWPRDRVDPPESLAPTRDDPLDGPTP